MPSYTCFGLPLYTFVLLSSPSTISVFNCSTCKHSAMRVQVKMTYIMFLDTFKRNIQVYIIFVNLCENVNE